MKRFFTGLTALAAAASMTLSAGAAYRDIPASGGLAAEVRKAVSYGLMNGYGPETFGYHDTVTRAQFLTVVGRMLGWFEGAPTRIGHITPAMRVDPPEAGTPQSVSSTYYHAIDTAAERDVVDLDEPFRPYDAVTRQEMAEILVRALGLKSAAALAERDNDLGFQDVADGIGYISIAYDIGMTKGTSQTTFSPDSTATRAQAAAMLVRIYEKLHQPLQEIHGFYALSSYSQLSHGGKMDAVSVGWSRMTWDGEDAVLSTTSANGNEYYVPIGYAEVVDYLTDSGVPIHLSVFMDASSGVKELLASAEGRRQAVEEIVQEATVRYKTIGRSPYSGVTIDFEGLRSAQKKDLTAFLQLLDAELEKVDRSLFVCVSPVLTGGAYYDGYDHRAIGELADRVILMAYDYESRDMSGFVGTPIWENGTSGKLRGWFSEASRNAPPGQVFWSLLAVTDPDTGVRDPGKVLLGYSCKNVAWEIDSEGRLANGKPVYFSNDTTDRYMQEGRVRTTAGSKYITFISDEGRQYFMWLEDPMMNLRSAKLLGIRGASLWRLGTIPVYKDWDWSILLDR